MKGSYKLFQSLGASSSASSGGAASSEQPITKPYIQLGIYPTRNGTTHIMSCWSSYNTTITSIVSVMMYLTTTPGVQIKFNDDWEIGDNNPFSRSMSNAVEFNLTSVCTDGNLYDTWWSQEGYTVVFAIQYYEDDADGNPKGWCTYHYTLGQTYSNFITSSAPTVTYDNGKITIGSLVAGRRIIEFRCTDTQPGGGTGITDEETLNEMFYTSLLNMEYDNPYLGYFYLSNIPKLERWRPGNYTVGVEFRSTINQGIISSAISSAISEINSVMNEFGIRFTRSGTNGDIHIIVDTEYNLYRIDPATAQFIYGGTWETYTDSQSNIYGGLVKLACDFQSAGAYFTSYATVAFEELLQTMGAGYDQIEYPYNTIHTEFSYFNKKSTMYDKDADILRLVYSNAVNTGDPYYDVCRKLNIPKGAYLASSDQTNTPITVSAGRFLERGGTYEIRAFIVNSSGQVSGTSSWVTIEVPEIMIDLWDWFASNGSASAAQTTQFYNVLRGTALPENGFSYLVWNDLVDKAYEVVMAFQGSWVAHSGYGADGCKVQAGDTMSASKFNEVRFNIGSIKSTGITDRTSGDEIFGSYVTKLTDTINEIVS